MQHDTREWWLRLGAAAADARAHDLNQYPDGKYISEVTDRLEFCKVAQGYTWSEIRRYFLDLAADSSKDSALVTLCKCNAAWCLAEMGDFGGAYAELDSLLDHADKDYLELTIALKILLAQMEEDELELQASPPGKRSLRTTDDGAILATMSAWERAEERLDSLLKRFSVTSPSESRLPTKYTLSCYPNPFNPSTVIQYEIPKSGCVSLRIYNLLGREITVLKEGYAKAGTHRAVFDGGALASGIYFARLEAGVLRKTHKLVLVR